MDKKLLLPILEKYQKKHGFISEESIKEISSKTGVPVSKIFGVATFYSMLNTEPKGKNIIRICITPSCSVKGSFNLIRFLENKLGIKLGETTDNGLFTLEKTSCIGCCDEAPAMLLNEMPYTNLTEEKLMEILEKCKS